MSGLERSWHRSGRRESRPDPPFPAATWWHGPVVEAMETLSSQLSGSR